MAAVRICSADCCRPSATAFPRFVATCERKTRRWSSASIATVATSHRSRHAGEPVSAASRSCSSRLRIVWAIRSSRWSGSTDTSGSERQGTKKKARPGSGTRFSGFDYSTGNDPGATSLPGTWRSGSRKAQIRGREIALAQHGHAAQQPIFGKFIPPQDHGSVHYDRFTRMGLERDTRISGLKRCHGA